MLRIALLSFFAILASAQGRCWSKGIFPYGECPDVDQDFSTALFVQCASLLQFGCIIQPSTTAPGKFACTLDPTKVASDKICPGDKVVFDGIEIRKNNILSYFLDLNAAPIQTDVYFLIDATGGMAPAIADLKRNIHLIINDFSSDSTSVAFGVGYYRDEADLNNGFQNVQPISTNLVRFVAAINALKSSGGRDTPEANLVALYNVATSKSIGWRANSRRIAVYIGDQPGHEPSCIQVTSLTRFNVARALKKARVEVVGINSGAKNLDGLTTSFRCGGPSAGSGQATHITTFTGGILKTAPSNSAVVETIRSAIKSVPRKYNIDEGDCASKITSTFSPKNPWFVLPWDSTTVKHTMVLKDGVCNTGRSFQCRFKFSDFGGALPGTSVAFVNVKGCSK